MFRFNKYNFIGTKISFLATAITVSACLSCGSAQADDDVQIKCIETETYQPLSDFDDAATKLEKLIKSAAADLSSLKRDASTRKFAERTMIESKDNLKFIRLILQSLPPSVKSDCFPTTTCVSVSYDSSVLEQRELLEDLNTSFKSVQKRITKLRKNKLTVQERKAGTNRRKVVSAARVAAQSVPLYGQDC